MAANKEGRVALKIGDALARMARGEVLEDAMGDLWCCAQAEHDDNDVSVFQFKAPLGDWTPTSATVLLSQTFYARAKPLTDEQIASVLHKLSRRNGGVASNAYKTALRLIQDRKLPEGCPAP